MKDEAELLRSYAEEGSHEDFAELVRRRIDLVYSVALRRVGGDSQRAEDVTQAVFRDLARKAGSLSRHATLGGWLFTSTRYAALQAMRTERRRQTREREATMMQELSFESDQPQWDRLGPVVDSALDELGGRDRQAILWRFYEGRPFGEIGRSLAVSEDGARMRVGRALEKLRALLEKRGIRSTTAALAVAIADHAVGAAPSGLAAYVAHSAVAGVSAGGGAVALVRIFSLMSTNKLTLGALGVLALTTMGTAVHEINRANEEARTQIQITNENERLRSQSLQLERGVRTAAVEQSRLEQELAKAKSAKQIPNDASNPDSFQVALAQMMANPRLVQLTLERYRGQAATAYAPLFKKLGLTTEQIAQATEMMTDLISQAAKRDLASALQINGFDHSSYPEFMSALASVIGPAGAEQFGQYEKTLDAQRLTNQLVTAGYYAGSTISAQQADQLTEIVAEASPTFRNGGQFQRSTVDWIQVVQNAGAILTPAQLSAVRSSVAQTQVQQTMAQAATGSVQSGTSPSP